MVICTLLAPEIGPMQGLSHNPHLIGLCKPCLPLVLTIACTASCAAANIHLHVHQPWRLDKDVTLAHSHFRCAWLLHYIEIDHLAASYMAYTAVSGILACTCNE
jgi:hypothetical protein